MSSEAGKVRVRRFWICLLALGISSVSVQLVMIREVMSSFGGNELVIGIVLGVWLLFTGLGSALGIPVAKRGHPEKSLFAGHLLITVLPFVQIAGMRALPLLWVRGEMIGLASAIGGSTIVLVPYCLVGGAMIPVAGSLLEGRDTTSRVFVADTMGDICGGLLFSLVLVYWFSHWDSFIVLGLLNLCAAIMMVSLRVLPLVCVLGIAVLAAKPFNETSLSWRFPGQEMVLNKNTPFAQLTISKTGRQLNVFQDAIPLFSTGDLDVEAVAHLPLCQVPEGSKILLIAGGVFGTLEEIYRHHPERVDYVELDPAILDLDRLLHNSLSSTFVHVHVGDGRLFVKKTPTKYDAVLVDLPDPENAQLNRFYTQEFFKEVKSILADGGVLSFTLIGSENYLEDKGLALNRSVYTALKNVFSHTLVFPGLTHYYLASDSPLNPNIAGVLDERGIVTKRLVDYELPTMADPFRIDMLMRLLNDEEVPANRDLSPSAFGHLIELWLKKSGSPRTLLYVIVFVMLALAVVTGSRDRLRFTIASSGYASMAFELALLLLFQVIYGYVYLRMCLFITLYMIGSALGALASGRLKRSETWQVWACDAGLILSAGLACWAAQVGTQLKGYGSLFVMQYGIIPFLLFVVAFVAGYQFSTVSRMARGIGAEITGRLYVSDLAGAACGTILTGLVFLPKMGVIGVLVSVAALKGVSLALNVRRA